MPLYKQKNSKVWWMSYCFRGRQMRKSTGTTNKKLAEEIYCKRKTEVIEGTFLENSKGRNKTFKNLVDRYLEEVSVDKKPNSRRDDKMYARNWLLCFGDCFPNEITSDQISLYLQKRKKTVGPSTINRELAFLSAAFNKAIKVWKWCKDNPVSQIPREKEKKRVKYFSDEEFSEIYNNLVDWVKPMVILAKNTGLRVANIVNLTWSQVDLKLKKIVIQAEEMKNFENLGIPLNAEATRILKDQFKSRKLHSSHVFCNKKDEPYSRWGLSHAFKRACKIAGHPEYRFHDLRHDFCSKLVQQGVDLYSVKELAGHKDITTTQRYSHLSPDRLKRAVDSLDLSYSYHSPGKKGLEETSKPLK